MPQWARNSWHLRPPYRQIVRKNYCRKYPLTHVVMCRHPQTHVVICRHPQTSAPESESENENENENENESGSEREQDASNLRAREASPPSAPDPPARIGVGKSANASPKRAAKLPRDPLLDHPAVVAYHELARLTPNTEQRAAIAAAVSDKERWRCIVREWLMHGWKPGNVAGMLERYAGTGISPPGIRLSPGLAAVALVEAEETHGIT